ncbi:erg26, C-3 sterol dehydrogenase [Sporothrix curviconia]|uniref:Erg26, C-3 sterol dehydrogenase n=1 Tax=Sporothrix curviconia TaxID=1260050 RepID=A0ABP0BJT5_9PEZI
MAQQQPPEPPSRRGALVIGGCGFLGYHLVQHLGKDASFSPLHVLDVNITNNRVDDVMYTQGTITDGQAVHSTLQRFQPRVVFHMASPPASLPSNLHKEFDETNVKGTQTLLEASKNAHVEAFVYTSTVDVYADPPHNSLGEDAPLWTDVSGKPVKMSEYCRTKAIADGLVRIANSASLPTVVLRPGHVYGERHTQGLYEILDAASGTKPLVQLKTDALMDVASADNVAAGHVLAAKALLNGVAGVAGEAFNVSDGSPVPFWHHARVIWTVARGKKAVDNIWTLPTWVMNIAKAQRLLGFKPVVNHDEVLAESVRWELKRRGQQAMG